MNHAAFRIAGVSLPTPPWPDNPVQSAAVLLNPTNEKRLGQHSDLRTVRDRQRRIYVNLVVLFRLVTRCQHLAFDRDAFWPFIARHWSITNAGPKKVEDLVDIYATRRRAYLDLKRKHLHRDLLTDLIDAWNSRDPHPLPSPFPSRDRLETEWDRIETSWLDELRYDHHLLLDESNPPHPGTFPFRHKTPSVFKIKGGSSPPLSCPGLGKSLFERITDPSLAPNPVHPATNYSLSPQTPTQKLPEKAIDDLIQSESHKRRFGLETPPSSAKRQCVPRPESPPHLPTLEQQRVPETSNTLESLRVPRLDKQDTQETPTRRGPKAAQDVDHSVADTIKAESRSSVNGEAQSCPGQQTASPAYDSELLQTLETRIQEHDREVKMLKEQTDLFLESEELSRDVRKAHDQLTISTASQCQKALERLDELSSHINGMGEEVMACRRAGQDFQECHAKQQSLIDGYKGDLKSVNSGLKEVQRTLLAQRELQHNHEKSTDVEARLSQLETKLENPAGIWLQTKEGIESRLSALETQVKEQVATPPSIPKEADERIEKTETTSPIQWYKDEFEARLQTMEESITVNTTLINNCRTLVEVSKTSLDQHLGSLDSRIQLLEHRFSNHVAVQTKMKNEQAKRIELVEAELKMYKQAASSQSQQRSTRPLGSEFADFQAQLNALRNSLAVVARNQRADQTQIVVAMPSTPVSQVALDDLSRPRQSKPSASSLQITSDHPVVKEES